MKVASARAKPCRGNSGGRTVITGAGDAQPMEMNEVTWFLQKRKWRLMWSKESPAEAEI